MAVVIVCKSTLLKDMLQSACQEKGHDVRQTCDSIEGITAVEDGDVVLIYTLKPCKNMVPAMSFLKSLGTKFKILILCSSSNVDDLRKDLGTEVDAIIPDTLHIDILTVALTMLESGYVIVHSDQMQDGRITDRTASETRPVAIRNHPENDILSRREAAILASLQTGLPNKSIGKQLGISEATVKVHLRAIYRKVGAKNRTQAALWGAENL